MCASPFSFFRAGPPPPKIALLPDAMFFTRNLPVAAGATAADVAVQVELALEALSPFPIAQLYHGHFWKPGAERAFAFAAYRRRFATEQTAEWARAEFVLPTFATVFGAEVAPGTTIVLAAPEGLTAVHWESSAGPASVLCRPLAPEATDEDRARTREELLRAAGSGRTVDLAAPPAAEPTASDHEIVFRAGAFVSTLPSPVAAALDVRDKAQLAALRRAQMRDLWLWRTTVGSAVAILLLLLGEFALLGGTNLWQKSRVTKLNAQRPAVERILNDQNLAIRIEELATKRLLPFEMITVVSEKKPEAIQFIRTTTNGIDTLIIDGQTGNAAELIVYKSALQNTPECERAVTTNERTVNNLTTFTLTVTFKPAAIKPSTPVT